MAIFLDTQGYSDIAIAVCDRCKMKRSHSVMRSDPNFPGLQVCNEGCADEFDPYRLPARKTEKITIRFPRPDVSVAIDSNNILAGESYGEVVLSTEGNTDTPENNGNVDGLEI